MMIVSRTPEIAPEAPAMAANGGTAFDMAAVIEANVKASKVVVPVSRPRNRAGPPVSERTPHPGYPALVGHTDEVWALARAGMTVQAIAATAGLTRFQVETLLGENGTRRLYAPPKRIGGRKLDRAAVRAAHAAGETRNAIAARLCVSLASVSLAVNEGVGVMMPLNELSHA